MRPLFHISDLETHMKRLGSCRFSHSHYDVSFPYQSAACVSRSTSVLTFPFLFSSSLSLPPSFFSNNGLSGVFDFQSIWSPALTSITSRYQKACNQDIEFYPRHNNVEIKLRISSYESGDQALRNNPPTTSSFGMFVFSIRPTSANAWQKT